MKSFSTHTAKLGCLWMNRTSLCDCSTFVCMSDATSHLHNIIRTTIAEPKAYATKCWSEVVHVNSCFLARRFSFNAGRQAQGIVGRVEVSRSSISFPWW